MKYFTTTLLLILILSCKAQDTLVYYSTGDVDSLVTECDSNLTACQEFVQSLIDVMDNPTLYGDAEVIIEDSINTIRLKKEQRNTWFEIFEGTKRYEFWIVNDILQVWIGDSLNARLLLQLELNE